MYEDRLLKIKSIYKLKLDKMQEKSRTINKLNYYIILSICIFQIAFFIYRFIYLDSKSALRYIRITNWSFYISSIYLFSILICDTSLYFFSSKKLEKYNHFIRNSFSNIAFPYCFMITIGFWGLILIGIIMQTETLIKSGTEFNIQKFLFNLHLHLGITILMIIDLFLNEKEKVKLNWFSCLANTFIFIIYCIVVVIEKYIFDLSAYVFIEKLNLLYLIIIGIVIYGLLVGCFFIYMVLSNRINRKSFIVSEEGEDVGGDENLIINENEENNYLIPE